MLPTPPPWPRCGAPIRLPARFCNSCGAPLCAQGPWPAFDTHAAGFSVVAVLSSLLWFRINGVPIFSPGFVVGLALPYWSHHINRTFGRGSLVAVTGIL